MYSVPSYSGEQFVELANPNFFHAKGNSDDNYKIILSIFKITIPFPLTSVLLFSVVTIYFIQPKIYEYAKTASKKTFKVLATNEAVDDSKSEDLYVHMEGQHVKNSHLLSVFATSVTITIALFVCHIISGVTYIQYGNEVLYNRDLDHSDYSSNSDDQALPIFHMAFSLFTITIALLMIIFGYVIFNSDTASRKEGQNFKLHKSVAVGLSINIIYLGSYFTPYMLLAFIHNPVQTSFVYLFGAILVVCVYLLFLGLSICCGDAACWDLEMNKSDEERKELDCFGFCCCLASWTAVMSVIYIAIVVIFIFTFGSFNNFQELQNLVFPLVIGLLTIIFLKPAFKHIKLFHKDENDNVDNQKGSYNVGDGGDLESGKGDHTSFQMQEENPNHEHLIY